MAGERSRASFLLQLGLRAIAAGNTGGWAKGCGLAWQCGWGKGYWLACRNKWRASSCGVASASRPILPSLLTVQAVRATASSWSARTCSSNWTQQLLRTQRPPTWRRCSAGAAMRLGGRPALLARS